MYINPLFVGIPGGLQDTSNIAVADLLGASGLNSGNFLFVAALRRLLLKPELVYEPFIERRIEDGVYDYIAISASNWIRTGFNFEHLLKTVESTVLPCLTVSLGAQSDAAGNPPKLDKTGVRFLKIISERSRYISVRGQYTQDILEDYGVYNTWVTGCPSIIGFDRKFLKLQNRIEVSSLSKVVIQGTRHGIDNALFSDKANNNLNLQLYRFAFQNNLPLLLQSERPDIYCRNNEPFPKGEAEKYTAYLEKVYGGEIDDISRYLSQMALIYWDVETWFSELSRYDALVGTRIHGVVSALLSGIPAVLLTHDSRTSELAKSMNIPSINLSDISKINENSILNIISGSSLEKLKVRFEQYENNFISFLNSNNVGHEYQEKMTVTSRP